MWSECRRIGALSYKQEMEVAMYADSCQEVKQKENQNKSLDLLIRRSSLRKINPIR